MNFDPKEVEALYQLVSWRASKPDGDSWSALRSKLESMRIAQSPSRLVFRMELPIEPVPIQNGRKFSDVRLAPTLNEYAGQPAWMRNLARKEVDRRIDALKYKYPLWECWKQVTRKIVPAHVTSKGKWVESKIVEKILQGKRRFIRVTRCSAGKHDEPSTDAIGGKIPIDRLRICGVIAGDSQKWIGREAVWKPAPRGEGLVIVEVFED